MHRESVVMIENNLGMVDKQNLFSIKRWVAMVADVVLQVMDVTLISCHQICQKSVVALKRWQQNSLGHYN